MVVLALLHYFELQGDFQVFELNFNYIKCRLLVVGDIRVRCSEFQNFNIRKGRGGGGGLAKNLS